MTLETGENGSSRVETCDREPLVLFFFSPGGGVALHQARSEARSQMLWASQKAGAHSLDLWSYPWGTHRSGERERGNVRLLPVYMPPRLI